MVSLIDINKIFFPFGVDAAQRIIDQGLDFAYYTSVETIFNILKYKKLWLRNIRCMNDYREIIQGKELIIAILKENNDYRLKRLLNLFSSIHNSGEAKWKQIIEDILVGNSFGGLWLHTYIICFTEHNNAMEYNGNQSMFDAYGRGNGGCLVLDGSKLMNLNLPLSKVFYVDEKNKYKLAEQVDRLIGSIANHIDELQECDDKIIEEIFKQVLIFAICSIKHTGFERENEWRLIINKKIFNYDVSANDFLPQSEESIGGIPQIIQQVNLQDFKWLIKDIIIEQRFEAHEEVLALNSLLTKWASDNTLNVRVSDIPIRR